MSTVWTLGRCEGGNAMSPAGFRWVTSTIFAHVSVGVVRCGVSLRPAADDYVGDTEKLLQASALIINRCNEVSRELQTQKERAEIIMWGLNKEYEMKCWLSVKTLT